MLSVPFSVLLLIFFYVPLVASVCDECFGEAPGCPGTGRANCPWTKTVAANATALAAGGVLMVAVLLPAKIQRLFPRAALDAVSALSYACSSVNFDPHGKSDAEVLGAVKRGQLSASEGIAHFTEKGLNLPDDTKFENSAKKLSFAIETIKALPSRINTAVRDSTEGAKLYVLSRLSLGFASSKKGSTSFDLCVSCDDESSSSSSASSSNKAYSASLVRPQSEHHMYALLNSWVGTSHALGLVDVLASTVMLEDIIYEPVRSGAIIWCVAFECFVIYLRMLESQGPASKYNAANVYHMAGGIDAVRAQALIVAKDYYPAAFFRTHGGIPLHNPATGGDADIRVCRIIDLELSKD